MQSDSLALPVIAELIAFPASHGTHNAGAELPLPTAYVPAEQAMQAVSVVDAVPTEYLPAEQSMHPSDPELGWY